MLPPILSEKLCSLNPDEDKFAFSAIFTLDQEGLVLSHEFVKSVIRPKLRLNYDEANALLDGTDVPELADKADYRVAVESLHLLHQLAVKMRKRRIDAGAVALDKIEIQFSLQPAASCEAVTPDLADGVVDGFPEPTGFHRKTRGKSSYLIEEFMLLANQASASVLFNHLLDNRQSKLTIGALLRMHSGPSKGKWHIFNNCCKDAGMAMLNSDSLTIQEQINELKMSHPSKSLGLDYLTYFSMEMALYCCAENHISMNDPSKTMKVSHDTDFPFYHFGLNVPLYTHFTSPIRRYADILVHRQLDAIIKSKKGCGIHLSHRLEAAHNSNVARLANRRIGDQLTSTYMAAYLNKQGWRLTKAILLTKSYNHLKVLLPSLGIVSLVEMRHFAPWALECVEEGHGECERPKQIHLKYLTEVELYSVNVDHGFSQYVYVWDRDVDRDRDMGRGEDGSETDESTNSLHDDDDDNDDSSSRRRTVDGFRLGTQINDEANRRISNAAASTVTVNIFDEVDCLVYCSKSELKLCVELPFPPALLPLQEDASSIVL